jgi:outer membrane lipoprotein SlyB
MEFNKLVFAGLSIGCLTAAAGGSYLAVRQNQAAIPDAGASGAAIASEASLETPGALGAPAAPAGPGAPVTESEGVIAPETAIPAKPELSTPSRRPQPVATAPASSRASSSRPSAPAPARRDPAPAEAPAVATNSPAPSAPQTSGGTMWESRPSVQPSVPEYKDPEPPPPPPPPAPEFLDVTVPSDAVLGLQIERTVSSELARVEDKVEARVTRDVRVENRVAIPAGSTVRGSVTEVDKGGRMKGKARLAIRFHTIVLADGTQVALKTDPVVREGQSAGGESAAKVGGAAIGGAILGAILGGGKGAAIGGAVGAAGGTAAAMTNDRNPATLPAGTTVTVRMQAPVTVTVQKE